MCLPPPSQTETCPTVSECLPPSRQSGALCFASLTLLRCLWGGFDCPAGGFDCQLRLSSGEQCSVGVQGKQQCSGGYQHLPQCRGSPSARGGRCGDPGSIPVSGEAGWAPLGLPDAGTGALSWHWAAFQVSSDKRPRRQQPGEKQEIPKSKQMQGKKRKNKIRFWFLF